MNFKTLVKKMESKDRIVKVAFEMAHAFANGTPAEYNELIDKFYKLLNKEFKL